MKIEDLKNEILSEALSPGIIVFVNSENSFVAKQYSREIARIKNKTIEVIESLDEISAKQKDIFSMNTKGNVLYICYIDNFISSEVDPAYAKRDDLIIFANKATVTFPFEERTVKVPVLEEWQVKDYIYSNVEGVDKKQLDWLQTLCKNDIYRISEEVDKIALFDKNEQQAMFNKFIEDNVFSDLSLYNIFNMSSAILDKNITELRKIWKELDRIDVEPLGMVTVLLNNIRNIINIQLDKNATAEKIGMSPKQFYYVSKSCGRHSKERLIEMFLMLTSIDKKLKTGELPANMILDYIILNMIK